LLGDVVKYKKYFYVLRPILACKWILAEGTPPPMEFHILMEKYLDEKLKPDVEKLLDLKMNSPEIAIGKRFDRVNEYIDNAISELDAIVSTLPSDKIESWDELNNMFLEILK
jgi:predicted nucleotidyltransferase